MPDESPKRHKWFQFTLRTLLVAVLVLSVPLSWFAVRMEQSRKQKRSIEALEAVGCGISYEAKELPAVVVWAESFLGRDFFYEPTLVYGSGSDITDDDLKHLASFRQGDGIELDVSLDNTSVTDAGLQYLTDVPTIHSLRLGSTRVTDAGLRHLKRLPRLRSLALDGTWISDAGLEQLTEIADLENVVLWDTNVTPDGAKTLQAALPNCDIYVLSDLFPDAPQPLPR